MLRKLYSIRKSRKILHSYFTLFKRKQKQLSSLQHEKFESQLRALDAAVLANQRQQASDLAKKLESFCKSECLRNRADLAREVCWALVFAIVVAFIIRQFWFELYEVPTGSMRPTIQELDRLAVSKTTFGIHLPFQNKLLFYSPERIQRGGIIVLTTENLDLQDPNMLYFGIIPGKKRYVKRCVSRPGDTLYFYGGYIYGIDAEDKPFTQLSDSSYLKQHGLENLIHIPYISFEGKTVLKDRSSQGFYLSSTFQQMDQNLGKLTIKNDGQLEGRFFNGTEWIKDNPQALKLPHATPVSYSDMWGIGNFAMARLLTAEQAQRFYSQNKDPSAVLYLELHHTPNMSVPKPTIRRGENGRTYPLPTPYTALIPLTQEHLDRLSHALTTSRFCVKKGLAFSYQKGRKRPQPTEFDIRVPGIPNGCYEFYDGQGYQVFFGGFRRALPSHHALYKTSPSLLCALFNTGIGWNRLYEPVAPLQPYQSHRYAYYRQGDLYVMGAPLLTHQDPTLQRFVQQEQQKEQSSSSIEPYIAFVDRGPPLLENGELDIEKIRHFGLKIPDHAVLALGDNYAMSADSREFGFVPVNNLRGAPSFTFWPPSHRLGSLVQPPYPWLTLPNLLIWSLAGLTIVACWWYYHCKNKKSLF
ncbi:MAG: signal peptidase I [Verrucomicrobia bacterium]|nr:signal peptidase I [Verrucomicrobiota bacterium]MBS0645562.1 signal peptidase I [Verrucomicrobiota bacterium]